MTSEYVNECIEFLKEYGIECHKQSDIDIVSCATNLRISEDLEKIKCRVLPTESRRISVANYIKACGSGTSWKPLDSSPAP